MEGATHSPDKATKKVIPPRSRPRERGKGSGVIAWLGQPDATSDPYMTQELDGTRMDPVPQNLFSGFLLVDNGTKDEAGSVTTVSPHGTNGIVDPVKAESISPTAKDLFDGLCKTGNCIPPEPGAAVQGGCAPHVLRLHALPGHVAPRQCRSQNQRQQRGPRAASGGPGAARRIFSSSGKGGGRQGEGG